MSALIFLSACQIGNLGINLMGANSIRKTTNLLTEVYHLNARVSKLGYIFLIKK